jgi:hypothetical protein
MKKRLIIGSFIFLSITAIGFFLYDRTTIFADFYGSDEEKIVDRYQITLGSGRSEKFLMIKNDSTDSNPFKLSTDRLFQKNKTIDLLGFENYVFLKKHLYFQGEDLLFFTGDVGVHSRNLFIVEAKNETFLAIRFIKNGQEEPTLVSDLPSFRLEDSEGMLDIFAYYRDYDQDPTKNYFVDRYRFSDQTFRFLDRQSGIVQSEAEIENLLGGIK